MEQSLEYLLNYNDPNFSIYNYNINIYFHLKNSIPFECLNFLSSLLLIIFWFLIFFLFFSILFYLIKRFLL